MLKNLERNKPLFSLLLLKKKNHSHSSLTLFIKSKPFFSFPRTPMEKRLSFCNAGLIERQASLLAALPIPISPLLSLNKTSLKRRTRRSTIVMLSQRDTFPMLSLPLSSKKHSYPFSSFVFQPLLILTDKRGKNKTAKDRIASHKKRFLSFLSFRSLWVPLGRIPLVRRNGSERTGRTEIKKVNKNSVISTILKKKKSTFLKERNAYLIPDFVEIQRKSFFQLLENGLIEEFSKRNPITNKNLEIFFYPEYYQLTPPEYNPRRAILISKSYSSKLYIPVQLTDKKLKKSQLKWVLIGNLPLMTKRGHFVLNGAPRVIVNQILRSPGIYFQGSLKEVFSDQWSEKPEKTFKRFYTDLICLRGTWLRIEIDKNKDIWAQMKKVPKIPLLWFLLAMGLTERIIFKSVISPTRLLANFNLEIKRKMDYEYVTNASDAWKAIANLISSSNKETGSSASLLPFEEAEGQSAISTPSKNGTKIFSEPTGFSDFESDYDSDSDSSNNSYIDSNSDSEPNSEIDTLLSISESKPTVTSKNTFLPSFSAKNKKQVEKNGLILSLNDEKEFLSKQIVRNESPPSSYGPKGKERTPANKTILGTIEKNEKKKNLYGFPSSYGTGTPTLLLLHKNKSSKVGGLAEVELDRTYFKKKEGQETEKKKFLVSFLNKVENSKEGRNWIFKRFMNPRAYDLGSQGRLNFNRKLGLSISSNQTTLTAQDVLFATDYLFKVEKGLKNIDDIDHLKNRRVRTSGELIQIQIGIGLVRLEKIIRDKLSKINAQTRASDFLTSKPNKKKHTLILTNFKAVPSLINKIKRGFLRKKHFFSIDRKHKANRSFLPFPFPFPKGTKRTTALPFFLDKRAPLTQEGVKKNKATHERDKNPFPVEEPRGEGLPFPFGTEEPWVPFGKNPLGKKKRKREGQKKADLYVLPLRLRSGRKKKNQALQTLQELKKTNKQKKSPEPEPFSHLTLKANFLSKTSQQAGKNNTLLKKGGTGSTGEEFKMTNIINTKAFNGALREFFGSSQLSQFMDQLNPLAEITHKRRLSSMGPGGVTRDSATLAIRGIHPTHYGRICPIETPEGKNTGLVNSLTTYARTSAQGFLESPFYKVYKGQVQKNAGMFFLSAEQEEKIKLASADVATPSGRIGFLPKNKIPAKIAYGDTISKISRNIVEYIGVSPIQMISIATSLIPFLEHDDANRALMGSNMQRQAVPLVRAERPLVGTGLESRAVSDSGHAVIAKESGYVAYVSGKKMVIYTIPIQN